MSHDAFARSLSYDVIGKNTQRMVTSFHALLGTVRTTFSQAASPYRFLRLGLTLWALKSLQIINGYPNNRQQLRLPTAWHCSVGARWPQLFPQLPIQAAGISRFFPLGFSEWLRLGSHICSRGFSAAVQCISVHQIMSVFLPEIAQDPFFCRHLDIQRLPI